MREALLKTALSDIIKLAISVVSLVIISRVFGLSSYGEFAFFVSSASLVSMLPSQFPSFKATTELVNKSEVQSLFASALLVKILVYLSVVVIGLSFDFFAMSFALLLFTLSFVLAEYLEAWLLYERKLSIILQGNLVFGAIWISFLSLSVVFKIDLRLENGYAFAMAVKAVFYCLSNRKNVVLVSPNIYVLNETISKSLYYAVIRVMNQLNEQMPIIWLMSFSGPSVTGTFAIAQKVIIPVQVAIGGAFKVIFNDGLAGKRLQKSGYLLVGVMMVLVAKILGYFSYLPLSLLKADTPEAVAVLSVLAFDMPIVFLSNFYSNELLLNGNKLSLLYVSVIQGLIYLPIMYNFVDVNLEAFVNVRFICFCLLSCVYVFHLSLALRSRQILLFWIIPLLSLIFCYL